MKSHSSRGKTANTGIGEGGIRNRSEGGAPECGEMEVRKDLLKKKGGKKTAIEDSQLQLGFGLTHFRLCNLKALEQR